MGETYVYIRGTFSTNKAGISTSNLKVHTKMEGKFAMLKQP
ncbi:hypothetical protein [Chitinophaga deserti]|nr:hypothetical protein [Chitinophaga deserti]